MIMGSDKFRIFTGYFVGVVGGFLLRGNLYREDSFLGYISTFMFLGLGAFYIFMKPKTK